MLNFRYLFILFLFLSFNSYPLLEFVIRCGYDLAGNPHPCIDDQAMVSIAGNNRVWEVFDIGFDNTLESINESFDIVVNDFPNWEVIGAANSGTTDWVSLLTSSSYYDGSYASQVEAWNGYYDAAWRDKSSSISENYAKNARNSAWINNNYAVFHKNNALVNKNSALFSASAAAVSALAAKSSADDVQSDITKIDNAKTKASTDINNQIQGMVDTIDEVEAQALTNIEQYVSDVLNTPVNVVDNELVMITALGAGTGSLNALASNISNAGNSQDNTALVNSLNGLSSSVSGLGAVGNTGIVNAVGSLNGVLGANIGALGGLSNVITDGDGSGEIDNKSAGLFNALKNSFVAPSFSRSGVSCPTWAFDEGALLVGGLVIDSHCEVIDMIRPSFEFLMISFFSMIGFRTVFSA